MTSVNSVDFIKSLDTPRWVEHGHLLLDCCGSRGGRTGESRAASGVGKEHAATPRQTAGVLIPTPQLRAPSLSHRCPMGVCLPHRCQQFPGSPGGMLSLAMWPGGWSTTCSAPGSWPAFGPGSKLSVSSIRWPGQTQLEISVDFTTDRVHIHAAGVRQDAPERLDGEPDNHALDRSRGGFFTTISFVCNQYVHSAPFTLTDGQAGGSLQLMQVLDRIRVRAVADLRP